MPYPIVCRCCGKERNLLKGEEWHYATETGWLCHECWKGILDPVPIPGDWDWIDDSDACRD